MQKPDLFFQYCPKLILFSEDWSKIFLARRKDEDDYDGVFTFIGGKLETTDASLQVGIKREKDEEISKAARVKLCLTLSYPVLFRKKDGNSMVVAHHIAQFIGGNVNLNQKEYSEYSWISIGELDKLKTIVKNIPEMVDWALKFKSLLKDSDFIEI